MFNENRYFNEIIKKHREKENAKSQEELGLELIHPFKDVTYDMKLVAKVNKNIERCIKCCKSDIMTETCRQYMLNLLKSYHLEVEESFTQEDVEHTYPYYLQMTLEGLRRLVYRYHVWGYLPRGIRYLPIWYLLDCIENHLLKNL